MSVYMKRMAVLCIVLQGTGCLFDEISQQQPSTSSQDMYTADMSDASVDMVAGDMSSDMAGDMVADMSVDMKATCRDGQQDNDGDGACSPACDVLTCGAPANTCDDSSGLIECICALGYMGPRCGMCAEGHHREAAVCVPDEMPVCNLNCGEQECQIINGMPQCVGGQPMCSPACGPGQVCQFNANNMPQCMPDTCMPGTQDLNGDGMCHPTCAVWEMGDSCGRGTCVIDMTQGQDSSGKPVCDCDDGWRGSSPTTCDVCADGYVMDSGECVPGCSPACEDSQKCDIEAVGGPTCVDLTCADITCGEFSACVLGAQGPACECVVGTTDSDMDGVLESGESCVVTHPQTCAQAKSVYGSDSDGHYKLYVDNDPGKPWWAWCKDMFAASPLEYLPLAMTHDEHNVFERFGMPHAPSTTSGAAGAPYDRRLTRTYYEKVRIDPVTLRINIFDAQFAQTEVYQDTDTDLNLFHEAVPFGVAQGCSLISGEEAHGEVNLEQTPFAVLGSFSQVGVCPANTMSTGTGQKIALQAAGGSASGGCGAIVPDSYSPYFKMGCSNVSGPAMTGQPADPFVLQLAYSNAAKGVDLLPKTCKEAYALGHCVAQQMDSESCSLYVGRDPDKEWTATCIDPMSDNPTTYVAADVDGGIGLTDTATIDANGNRTNCSSYEYFRLEPHTMRVDIKDHRFSSIVCSNGDHNDVGVALSCSDSQGSTVVSQVFLESWTHLVLQSGFRSFGQCNAFAPSGGYSTLGDAYFTKGGSHIDENGMMMVGCGGVAPAEYAAQFGYQSCNAQDDTQSTDVPARPSTQQNYLLHLKHTDGNP